MKGFIIFGIVAILALIAISPFSIVGSQISLDHYNINSRILTAGYKLGEDVVSLSLPSFTCTDADGVVKWPERSECWNININDVKTKYGDDIVRDGYKLKRNNARATAFCEDGACKLLSPQDHRIEYDLELTGNITLDGTIPIASSSLLNEVKTVSLKWKTTLPQNLKGGINVITKNRILQQQDSFVIFGDLDSPFSIPLEFSEIGQHIIEVQPFIEVYDYNKGFIGVDTGLCSVDLKDNLKYCVQTTRTPVGKSTMFDVYTSPSSCNNAEECGGSFDCIGNVCSLNVEGNRTIVDYLVLLWRKLFASIGGL